MIQKACFFASVSQRRSEELPGLSLGGPRKPKPPSRRPPPPSGRAQSVSGRAQSATGRAWDGVTCSSRRSHICNTAQNGLQTLPRGHQTPPRRPQDAQTSRFFCELKFQKNINVYFVCHFQYKNTLFEHVNRPNCRNHGYKVNSGRLKNAGWEKATTR